ncbi:hypothetical protein KAJ38_00795 [Candidatus Pacearchaeota archaeon]|nr:hypothetical protein [Candidatus Pacearchaeota archaeon]
MNISESGDKRFDLCFSSASLTKYLECSRWSIFQHYLINQDDSIYDKKILSLCEKIPKDPFPESMMENPNTKKRAEESGFDKQDLCYFSMAIHLNKLTSLDISKDDQVFLCEQTRDRDLCLLYLADINKFRNSLFLCDLIEDETKKSQCSDLITKQSEWACEGNFPTKNETVKKKCVDYLLSRKVQ